MTSQPHKADLYKAMMQNVGDGTSIEAYSSILNRKATFIPRKPKKGSPQKLSQANAEASNSGLPPVKLTDEEAEDPQSRDMGSNIDGWRCLIVLKDKYISKLEKDLKALKATYEEDTSTLRTQLSTKVLQRHVLEGKAKELMQYINIIQPGHTHPQLGINKPTLRDVTTFMSAPPKEGPQSQLEAAVDRRKAHQMHVSVAGPEGEGDYSLSRKSKEEAKRQEIEKFHRKEMFQVINDLESENGTLKNEINTVKRDYDSVDSKFSAYQLKFRLMLSRVIALRDARTEYDKSVSSSEQTEIEKQDILNNMLASIDAVTAHVEEAEDVSSPSGTFMTGVNSPSSIHDKLHGSRRHQSYSQGLAKQFWKKAKNVIGVSVALQHKITSPTRSSEASPSKDIKRLSVKSLQSVRFEQSTTYDVNLVEAVNDIKEEAHGLKGSLNHIKSDFVAMKEAFMLSLTSVKQQLKNELEPQHASPVDLLNVHLPLVQGSNQQRLSVSVFEKLENTGITSPHGKGTQCLRKAIELRTNQFATTPLSHNISSQDQVELFHMWRKLHPHSRSSPLKRVAVPSRCNIRQSSPSRLPSRQKATFPGSVHPASFTPGVVFCHRCGEGPFHRSRYCSSCYGLLYNPSRDSAPPEEQLMNEGSRPVTVHTGRTYVTVMAQTEDLVVLAQRPKNTASVGQDTTPRLVDDVTEHKIEHLAE